MCESNHCKACGKDISISIEFGGAIAISAIGDGHVCDTACKAKYDARQLREYDALAMPGTNLCAFLGVPRGLDVGENAAFS